MLGQQPDALPPLSSSLATIFLPRRVPRKKVRETSDILLNHSLEGFLPWAQS